MSKLTDEQYLAEHNRITNDERYSLALKAWLIGKLDKMYSERNEGKEPPVVEKKM